MNQFSEHKQLLQWVYFNLFQFGIDNSKIKFTQVKEWENDGHGNILYKIFLLDCYSEDIIYVHSFNYGNIYQK